ncbi:hypothetical protein LINPERHAP2_LOCUS19873 [Linum perenne]
MSEPKYGELSKAWG